MNNIIRTDLFLWTLKEIEDLPELSQEFQASIQLTLPLKNKTVEILTLYDYVISNLFDIFSV